MTDDISGDDENNCLITPETLCKLTEMALIKSERFQWFARARPKPPRVITGSEAAEFFKSYKM